MDLEVVTTPAGFAAGARDAPTGAHVPVEVADVPAPLETTARTEGGVVVGVRHRDRSHAGVQFHPERTLTDAGKQLVANFLAAYALSEGRP